MNVITVPAARSVPTFMVPTSATAGKASSWQKMGIPVKVRCCLTRSECVCLSSAEQLSDPQQPLMLQVMPEDDCKVQLPQKLQKIPPTPGQCSSVGGTHLWDCTAREVDLLWFCGDRA